MDQYIEFLEPQEERPDPQDPSKVLPARGGAICTSSEDYFKRKLALEEACRILGKRCKKEIQDAISSMGAVLR